MKRIMCFLLIFGTLFCYDSEGQSEIGDALEVNKSVANVRSGPGPDFPIICQVSKGDFLIEYERKNGWVEVEVAETGDVGWIFSMLVSKLDYEISKAYRHFVRGLKYTREEKYDQAIYEYRKALKLDSTFFEARYNLGYAHFVRGEFEQAEKELKIALNQMPEDERTIGCLAFIYTSLKKFSEAENLIAKGLKIHPNSDGLCVCKGSLEIEQGNLKEAEAAVRKAIEINPENELAPMLLKEIEGRKLARAYKVEGKGKSVTKTGRWKTWVLGVPGYIIGAMIAQTILGLFMSLLHMVGLGAVALPGFGLDWLSRRFGIASSGKAEKFNWGMYIFTWAGPLYLGTQLLLIGIQATAIAVFTALFIGWFPNSAWVFGIMGWLWLWATIGITGLIAYAIIAYLLKIWLGTLGIFWSLFYAILG